MKLLTTTGDSFDLFADTVIELRNVNYLFDEYEEKSTSIDLPATDNNLNLLKRIHSPLVPLWGEKQSLDILEGSSVIIHTYSDYGEEVSLDVVLEYGSLSLQGKLTLSSFSREEIRGIISWTDLNAYSSSFLDKDLLSLDWETLEFGGDVLSAKEQVSYFYPDQSHHFVTMELALNTRLELTAKNSYRVNLRLNHQDYYSANGQKGLTSSLLLDNYSGSIIEDGTTIDSYGNGFWCAGFLKIDYILTKIFSSIGLAWDNSALRSKFSNYNNFCVAHNVGDLIVNGKIDEKQCLPDVKIKDFLKAIENYFGFFFTYNTKTVSMIDKGEIDSDISSLEPYVDAFAEESSNLKDAEYGYMKPSPAVESFCFDDLRWETGDVISDQVLAYVSIDTWIKSSSNRPGYSIMPLDDFIEVGKREEGNAVEVKVPALAYMAYIDRTSSGLTYCGTPIAMIDSVNYLNSERKTDGETDEGKSQKQLSNIYFIEPVLRRFPETVQTYVSSLAWVAMPAGYSLFEDKNPYALKRFVENRNISFFNYKHSKRTISTRLIPTAEVINPEFVKKKFLYKGRVVVIKEINYSIPMMQDSIPVELVVLV